MDESDLELKQLQQQLAGIDITYYTDPLCCWSWALEPHWQKLCSDFRESISYKYRMGGLLPDWKNFHDPVNSVSRPLQMGPVWMHASQVAGVPIEHTVWMKDPPTSSYPACIAVKCAELQSHEAGEIYLRLAREEVMMHGKNISRQNVLVEIADKLLIEQPSFSIDTFRRHLKGDEGIEAFKADMHLVRTHNIQRFPSLVIKNSHGRGVLLAGYRDYSSMVLVLKNLSLQK